MGRASLIVDRKELEEQINKLESEKTFESIGDLCQAVADSDWGKSIRNSKNVVRGCGANFISNKIRDFGIKIKTQSLKGRATKVNKTNRAEKFAAIKNIKGIKESIKNSIPKDKRPALQKTLDKVIAGDIKASIRLACMSCCGFEGGHKTCNCTSCPLFPWNNILFPNRKSNVEYYE